MRKLSILVIILSLLFSGTIFAAEGDVVWTRTYNGSADDYDVGLDIATDGSGNVYVTGYETDIAGGINIWVRKYDFDGNEFWTRTHNGTANDWDGGSGIAVDGSGNVYVTGYESVTEEENNIWVRKYDSAGKELWTRTHSGTVVDSWDRGSGIAVDKNGNVYVTGWEEVTGAGGETQDIWVRKYDSDGNEVWTRTHYGTANGPDSGSDIAVDENGNVYVIGREWVTKERSNIWVRKYDSAGNEVWTKTHNGPANDFDEGYGITVDGSGNVYVTGCEYIIGEEFNIWVRKYEGRFGGHFKPPVYGEVKIQGGEKGYVNPRKGEKAKIHFQPSGSGTVKVKIYTLRGLLVWEKSKSVSGVQDFIEWNCRNKDNDVVASGIYVVYVKGPGIKATKKVAILK